MAVHSIHEPIPRTADPILECLVARRGSQARQDADESGFAGLGRELDPGWRDGRSPVPEAGGTGATAVARPPPPPAGHAADSRAKPMALTDGRRENNPAPGRLDVGQAKAGERPNRERCRSGGFSGGIEGGRSTPRQSANVLHRVGWLSHPNSGLASPAEPPKRPSGHRPGTTFIVQSRGSSSAPSSPASRTARTRPTGLITPRDCATLCRAPAFRPTRTPRGAAIVDPGPSYGPYNTRNSSKEPGNGL